MPFRERAEQMYRKDMLAKHGLSELIDELQPQPPKKRRRGRSRLARLRRLLRLR